MNESDPTKRAKEVVRILSLVAHHLAVLMKADLVSIQTRYDAIQKRIDDKYTPDQVKQLTSFIANAQTTLSVVEGTPVTGDFQVNLNTYVNGILEQILSPNPALAEEIASPVTALNSVANTASLQPTIPAGSLPLEPVTSSIPEPVSQIPSENAASQQNGSNGLQPSNNPGNGS